MKLPDGWKRITLEDILSQEPQNGYSPNCVEEETGRYVLGLGNLTDYGLNLCNLKNVPKDDQRINAFQLTQGDFLISRSNTPEKVGRVGVFKSNHSNIFYPDLMMRFRINENAAHRDFFEHVLTSKGTQEYYQSHAAGSSASMVKINKETVKCTPLLLPPLPEQKAIADLLSIWDIAIEKTEKLIAAKEQRFRWLLDELITKPSKSGKWREVRLGDLYGDEIIIEKGKPLTRDEIGTNGLIPVVAGGQTYSCYHDESTHKCETITISSSGAYAGYVWYHSYHIWASDCSVIYSNKINMRFLYHVLKSKQHIIYSLQSGGAQPHVYSKDLANMKLSIPNISEQIITSQSLDCASREFELLTSILNQYKIQKRGLMQKLLTGEWRVRY